MRNHESVRRFRPSILLWVFFLVIVGNAHAEDSGKKICVTDDLQRIVCLDRIPRRVVSFAPSFTEMVFALNAGDRLVGRTLRCNVPAEALKVPVIGAYLNPDLERVLASRPDLVLTNRSSARREVIHRLATMGIPVFVADIQTIDGVCSVIDRLGILLNREKRAREIVSKLKKRRMAIQEQVSQSNRPTVLFAVGMRPLVVAGGKSFIGALIREAGGINIAEDAALPFARYNMEEVIRQDPDLILVLNKDCSRKECIGLWRKHSMLTAVQNGRIYSLNADLLARPSPRIMDGLEELAGIFRSHSASDKK